MKETGPVDVRDRINHAVELITRVASYETVIEIN